MPNIGIVDDREVHRTTVAKNFGLHLKDSWGYQDRFPFQSKDEYITWIQEEDIAALVIDERLHEEAVNGINVDYNGHDLAVFLREQFPDYPIYVVTSHEIDQDLLDIKANVEDIIRREEFNKEPENYVPRIVRAGQRFFDQYQSELKKIAELSAKIATGKGGQRDSDELSSLQAKIGITSCDSGIEKSQLITELGTQLDRFNSLKEQIEQLLKEKN